MNPFLPLAAAALALAAPAALPDAPDRQRCQDVVTLARAASGQPLLDRSPANQGEPLLIAAVDKRIDNCRVMQMARDPRDIRPEPQPALGQVRLMPAR